MNNNTREIKKKASVFILTKLKISYRKGLIFFFRIFTIPQNVSINTELDFLNCRHSYASKGYNFRLTYSC